MGVANPIGHWPAGNGVKMLVTHLQTLTNQQEMDENDCEPAGNEPNAIEPAAGIGELLTGNGAEPKL